MYMNTTYKAFIAETAAKIAAEISKSNYNTNPRSFADDLMSDETCERIASAAVKLADKLASRLQDWWSAQGEHSTVMFDPQDTLMSGIEGGLNDICNKLDDIKVEIACGHNQDDL